MPFQEKNKARQNKQTLATTPLPNQIKTNKQTKTNIKTPQQAILQKTYDM